MRITGCQWDIAWEDPQANFARAGALLESAGDADLIVLPEMFSTGFTMDVAKAAEAEPSEAEAFLKHLALCHNAAVLGGLVRQSDDGSGRNELIAFDPSGEELVTYQKNRTFRYTDESDYYGSGSEVAVFEWQGWKVAPLICYDLRFPELFRRVTAGGAELIVVIASWPSVRVDHWLTLLRARAIENLAYVVGVNRCGSDQNHNYPGRSVVIDPWGEIFADAGDAEGLIEVQIDHDKVKVWREEFPALKDLEL